MARCDRSCNHAIKIRVKILQKTKMISDDITIQSYGSVCGKAQITEDDRHKVSQGKCAKRMQRKME